MKHTAYPTHSSAVSYLLVDKHGFIAPDLCEKIPESAHVVLVSRDLPSRKNITHIRYEKKIPSIPNTRYHGIFFVWDGQKDTLKHLPEFLQKAKQDNSTFIFIASYNHMHDRITANIFNHYKNAYVFIIGDLFGDGAIEKKTPIDSLLVEAKLAGTVQLSEMGLKRLYPIYMNDAVTGIMTMLQNPAYMGMPLHVFSKLPLTEIAVIRILQRHDPLIHVSLVRQKHKTAPHPQYLGAGIFMFDSKYPLHERLVHSYSQIKISEKEREVTARMKKTIKPLTSAENDDRILPENPIAQMTILFIGYCVIIFALFPLTGTFLFSYFGQQSLLSSKTNAEKGLFSRAASDASYAKSFLTISEASGKFLYLESILVGQRNNTLNLLDKISSGKVLAESLGYTFDAISKYRSVVDGSSKHPQDDFLAGTNALKIAIVNFQILQQTDNLPVDVVNKMEKLSPAVELLGNTIDVLPQLFGLQGEKHYLVLFQNNMELRPGGGFIGSYGMVTLDNGRMKSFTIHNVYDADGQLKGHVEPPFAIRRYMQIPHLYLRDSNFDVDFAKGARESATLLASEMGEKVDGVIGIDLSFVKQLIGVVGSVSVPEYGETVTAGNFFSKTESHAEKNSFPGSTQKQDFLQGLMKALIDKFQKGNISPLSLLEGTAKAVKEKHVVFAFSDTNMQDLFTANGLSSSLWEAPDLQNGGVHDFIGINEANIGVNKVNYFIQRSSTQHISFLPTGGYQAEYTITYRNTSEKDVWPGGDYTNYVRVILPKDATITSIAINGARQEITDAITDPLIYERPGFIKPRGLEVNRYVEGDKTIYGFLVTIPAGANGTVGFSYTLAQKFDLSKPLLQYSLKMFKQPGTDNDPFSLQISYPGSFRVVNASSGFTNQDGILSYLGYLSTDQLFHIDFVNK